MLVCYSKGNIQSFTFGMTFFSTNRNAPFTARAIGAPEARQAERETARAELADRESLARGARGARYWSAEGATGGARASAGGEYVIEVRTYYFSYHDHEKP